MIEQLSWFMGVVGEKVKKNNLEDMGYCLHEKDLFASVPPIDYLKKQYGPLKYKMLSVVFGSGVPFVGGVLDNLLDLVNTLGANGLVGLIVLAVLLDMYR